MPQWWRHTDLAQLIVSKRFSKGVSSRSRRIPSSAAHAGGSSIVRHRILRASLFVAMPHLSRSTDILHELLSRNAPCASLASCRVLGRHLLQVRLATAGRYSSSLRSWRICMPFPSIASFCALAVVVYGFRRTPPAIPRSIPPAAVFSLTSRRTHRYRRRACAFHR